MNIQELKKISDTQLEGYLSKFGYDNEYIHDVLDSYHNLNNNKINYTLLYDVIESDHFSLIEDVGINAYISILEREKGGLVDSIIDESRKYSDENLEANSIIALKAAVGKSLTNFEQNYSEKSQMQSISLNTDAVFMYHRPTKEQIDFVFNNTITPNSLFNDLLLEVSGLNEEGYVEDVVSYYIKNETKNFINELNKNDTDYERIYKIDFIDTDKNELIFNIAPTRKNNRFESIEVRILKDEVEDYIKAEIVNDGRGLPTMYLNEFIHTEINKDSDIRKFFPSDPRDNEWLILYERNEKIDKETYNTREQFFVDNGYIVISASSNIDEYEDIENTVITDGFVRENIENYYNILSESEREDYIYLLRGTKAEQDYINNPNFDTFNNIVNSSSVIEAITNNYVIFEELEKQEVTSFLDDKYISLTVIDITVLHYDANHSQNIMDEYIKNNDKLMYDPLVQENEMKESIKYGLSILNEYYEIEFDTDVNSIYEAGGLNEFLKNIKTLSNSEIYNELSDVSEIAQKLEVFFEEEDYLYDTVFSNYLEIDEQKYFYNVDIEVDDQFARHVFEETFFKNKEQELQNNIGINKGEDEYDL